jgi:hypothetical protein
MAVEIVLLHTALGLLALMELKQELIQLSLQDVQEHLLLIV